jgi:hypothetical protein
MSTVVTNIQVIRHLCSVTLTDYGDKEKQNKWFLYIYRTQIYVNFKQSCTSNTSTSKRRLVKRGEKLESA